METVRIPRQRPVSVGLGFDLSSRRSAALFADCDRSFSAGQNVYGQNLIVNAGQSSDEHLSSVMARSDHVRKTVATTALSKLCAVCLAA